MKVGDDIYGKITVDNSGRCIAISSDGMTVSVGAYDNDVNVSWSGHLCIYAHIGNSWLMLVMILME